MQEDYKECLSLLSRIVGFLTLMRAAGVSRGFNFHKLLLNEYIRDILVDLM